MSRRRETEEEREERRLYRRIMYQQYIDQCLRLRQFFRNGEDLGIGENQICFFRRLHLSRCRMESEQHGQ